MFNRLLRVAGGFPAIPTHSTAEASQISETLNGTKAITGYVLKYSIELSTSD